MVDDAGMDDAAYDIRPDLFPAEDIMVNYHYIIFYTVKGTTFTYRSRYHS
jgi:hypothetical protein